MPYCTAEDVRRAVDFPSSGAPIADADIEEFIKDSEDEIENIYHTKFGNVEDSGTADGDYSTTTFSDSSKSWTNDEYIGYVVWIYGGTGEGQYREITDNDATKLTVSPAFSTTPDATSTYRITKLGYKDQTVDGSGKDEMFVQFQPLITLNALSIDGTDVTVSTVHQYPDAGQLILGSDSEVSTFAINDYQLVNLKYIYGVYPLPRIIKRLCVLLAAMRTLTAQIAGTYDDFTSISLPHLSGSKGEPYTNIRESVTRFQHEVKTIIGVDEGKGVESRGWATYRPFTLFG